MAERFPHAPDNAERDRLDNGFSAGWGRHFLPAEEHVIDCHMHIDGREPWMVRKGLDQLFWELNRTSAAHSNPVCFEAFRCHLRYLKALRLPQDALDMVCWQNAKRIFSLAEPQGWFTATTRP